MSGHSKPTRKGSGVVKAIKVVMGLLLVVVGGLVILNFAHKPTFNTVANATGGWHTSLTNYFWLDVTRTLVAEAKLSGDDLDVASGVLDGTVRELSGTKGTEKQRAELAKAADALVGAWSAGKRSAKDVKPLVDKLGVALAAIGDPEPKAGDGDPKPAEDDAKPADGDAKPADGDAKPADDDAKPADGDAKPDEDDTDPSGDGSGDGSGSGDGDD